MIFRFYSFFFIFAIFFSFAASIVSAQSCNSCAIGGCGICPVTSVDQATEPFIIGKCRAFDSVTYPDGIPQYNYKIYECEGERTTNTTGLRQCKVPTVRIREEHYYDRVSEGIILGCWDDTSWGCGSLPVDCARGGGIPSLPTDEPRPTPTITPRPPTATITPRPPTATITPSPTPLPRTKVAFTVFLHGLGNSGDNANPASSLSNKNPRRKDRTVFLEVYDSANRKIASVESQIHYASESGAFSGIADLGTNIPGGNYIITLKSDQYLRNTFPGIQQLVPGQTAQLLNLTLVTGDVVTDNQLSLLDYNILYGCYTGSIVTAARSCTPNQKSMADLNDEGVVNHYDYNLFIRELSVQTGR